jgi:hypothetical protein
MLQIFPRAIAAVLLGAMLVSTAGAACLLAMSPHPTMAMCHAGGVGGRIPNHPVFHSQPTPAQPTHFQPTQPHPNSDRNPRPASSSCCGRPQPLGTPGVAASFHLSLSARVHDAIRVIEVVQQDYAAVFSGILQPSSGPPLILSLRV